MFKKILVGFNGSSGGKMALAHAATLARHDGSQITALWVAEPMPRYSDLPGEPEDQVESAAAFFLERTREIEALAAEQEILIAVDTRRGNPAKTIVTYAQEGGCDLIVLGHRHSSMWGNLLGHIADRVCDHAHCSVLVVKA